MYCCATLRCSFNHMRFLKHIYHLLTGRGSAQPPQPGFTTSAIPIVNATEHSDNAAAAERADERARYASEAALLGQVSQKWLAGDWEALSRLSLETLELHQDRAKLALAVAGALQQTGNHDLARKYISRAQQWGGDRKLIAQLLVASLHLTLGRVETIKRNDARALQHFRHSVIAIGGDSDTVHPERIALETKRLGLPEQTSEAEAETIPDHRNSSSYISEILITGDVLRPSPAGTLHQTTNIRWLHTMVRAQLICALKDGDKEPPIRMAEGDLAMAKDIFTLEDLEFCEQAWPSIYNGELSTQAKNMLAYYWKLTRQTLVIGFELPPSICKLINELGAKYINIRISQYRYLDDFLLNFTSNKPEIEERLSKYKMEDAELKFWAELEIQKRRHTPMSIGNDALVFFGQIPTDASLIRGTEGFDTYKNFRNKIIEEKNKHSFAYYKPHPHLYDSNAVEFFQELGFEVIDYNAYDLLSGPQLKTAMALNSGVLHEAKIFGKRIIKLSQNDIYAGTNPIQNAFLNSEFWQDVLCQKKLGTKLSIPNRPNILRESLGLFWKNHDSQ